MSQWRVPGYRHTPAEGPAKNLTAADVSRQSAKSIERDAYARPQFGPLSQTALSNGTNSSALVLSTLTTV